MAAACTQSGRRLGKAMRVFAIICLALVLACGGAVTYIYLNFRSLVAGIIRGPVLQQIQSAELPADQKAGIARTIDQLTEDFKNDRLSYQQLAGIFERLGHGPFFVVVEMESAKSLCLGVCQPAAEERGRMSRVFQRLQRGVVEGSVPPQRAEEALALIQMTDSGKHRAFKPNLTAREARLFIDRIRQDADQAGVPDEPYQVDFAGQLQRAVDAVLKPASPPAATQTHPAR